MLRNQTRGLLDGDFAWIEVHFIAALLNCRTADQRMIKPDVTQLEKDTHTAAQ